MIPLLLIYFIGVVLAYFTIKFFMDEDDWTVKDRAITLTLATASWLTLLMAFLTACVQHFFPDGKKAKW